MKNAISIKLICTNFPGSACCGRENIFLSIQKNKEVLEETPGDSLSKTFSLSLECNMGKDGMPNFLGPYVFGSTGDKFLYLVWYSKENGIKEMFRRAKIKLNVLSWEQINTAIAQGKSIEAHIKLTDKKGEPVCASLKAENISWQ
ncbi:MAG: DUF5990 family protein [Saprospiraceae bacterium]